MLKPLLAVVVIAAALVYAMYVAQLDVQVIALLGGLLGAALAIAVRGFTAGQEQSAREGERGGELEKAVATLKARLHFADEALPMMVAYVDAQSRYRYHSRAFGEWLGLRREKIDGQHMRDVHGTRGFAVMEAEVARALGGQPVQYEATLKIPGGGVHHVSSHYLPHFAAKKTPEGFYMIVTDLAERKEVQKDTSAHDMQQMFVESVTQQATGWEDAVERIEAAIHKGEFALFYQPIRSLAPAGGVPEHYEIFIRLLEEESNLVPPGAFFPLAEEHGLITQMDRWVVEHLLDWIASRKEASAARRGGIFFINVALDTMCDADFPGFIEREMRRSGVPGETLCFEIAENGLNARRDEVERFARLVKQSGCRIALSGFGRERVAVEALKRLPLDFLKIDGSVILGIQRSAVELGKLIGITRIAKVIGVRTVAEMVETAETLAKLRELEVDFAQGFGISRPQPLLALA